MQEEDSDWPSLKAPRLSSSVTDSGQRATWPGFLEGKEREGEVGEGRKRVGRRKPVSPHPRPTLHLWAGGIIVCLYHNDCFLSFFFFY